MADGKWARLGRGVVVGGAAVAGIAAVELAAIGGLIVQAALKYPKPVQDGPDPLVQTPSPAPRSTVVGTPDGALLHVAELGDVAGSDEIIVLIHGWTCNTSFWNPQFNHFVGDRAVVAYDQRGHGLSELGNVPVSVDLLGQDLQAVLDAVIPDGKRAVLVGHSMGGMTIMSWAAQFGAGMEEKISGIVLASTAAHEVVQRQQLVPKLPSYLKPVKAVVQRSFVAAPIPLPSNSLSAVISHYIALGPVARQAHVDFADEQIARCSPKARGAWGWAMYSLDVRAGLKKITVPTAVVVGTKDLLTNPEHAQELVTELRANGVLHSYTELPGAGHMVPFERSAAFNRLLDDLLADVSEAASN